MTDKSTTSGITGTTISTDLSSDVSKISDRSKPVIKLEKKQENGQKKPWWQNKNRNNNNNNNIYKPPKESVFKGTIIDMNGHTFQCHGEASHASQFTRTCEELQRYCLKN